VNLLAGRAWSPKQVVALTAPTPDIYIDGGRQFGKSYVGAARFVLRLQARIDAAAAAIDRGELRPWAGIGKTPADACLEPPTVQAWVLTPREKHLQQCRGYIRSYYQGAAARLLHPHPRMRSRNAGRDMWLLHRGVGCRISFVPASGWTAVTGYSIDLLWVDEAGLLDSLIWDAVGPLLWAQDGELIATGTPSLGLDHWFSAGCMSGLEPSHPYYSHGVVERSPRATTIIGTSYEAFSANVRERAKLDAKKNGPSWESQWVLGDWRLPDVFVYSEWEPRTHIVEYNAATHRLKMGGKWVALPRPSSVYGVIDWAYSSQRPGACVVYHIWRQNPLDPARSQPLIIAVADRQEAMAYNAHGWYREFKDLRTLYGVQRWYCDPSMDEMRRAAVKAGIGIVDPADKADKAGRINLVKSLLYHDTDSPPALLVSDSCKHLPRQFENYQYRLDAHKNPTDRPSDIDDHCLDCCAFLVGMVLPRGGPVPLSIAI
jgi:hypothetical protein